jgi:acyl-CoA thioester hydrolase
MTIPSFGAVTQLPTVAEGVVAPEHIDANGHMNVRHYLDFNVLGTFTLVEQIGVDDDYRAGRRMGLFTAEHHLRYHTELQQGDRLTVHARVLERSERALHFMGFLLDRERERLANTLEVLAVHVDLDTRRSTPMPPEIAAGFDRLVEQSRALPWAAPTCGAMGIRSSRADHPNEALRPLDDVHSRHYG